MASLLIVAASAFAPTPSQYRGSYLTPIVAKDDDAPAQSAAVLMALPPPAFLSTPLRMSAAAGGPAGKTRRAVAGDDNGGYFEDGTILTLVEASAGISEVTLIGTAHLSKRSIEQVTSTIESIRPGVVAVELDASRLHRIGLSESDLGSDFSTADDISPPPLDDDVEEENSRPWWGPFRDVFLDSFTKLARGMLTGMYEDMSKSMGDEMIGGGEFLAAINAARRDDIKAKIVLADRDSMATIRRASELALRTGDPLGVMNKLSSTNAEEMGKLESQVRKEMEGASEAEVMERLIETIKGDATFRDKLFARLEEEVPVFTRAFLTERDHIMAEAIRRELEMDSGGGATGGAPCVVVAVVGLAHLSGIADNLRGGSGKLRFQDAP